MIKFIFLTGTLFLSFSPAFVQASEVLTPEGRLSEPQWTQEEKQADISKRLIKNTPGSSIFWIRLKGSEVPHTHKGHDVTVFMLNGKVMMHLGAQSTEAGAGDVIDIPQGSVHWAENEGTEPALVYAVFTPLLQGKDYQPAESNKAKKD